MSVNQYPGICAFCNRNVPAGRGDFQSKGSLSKKTRYKLAQIRHPGKWLVRCFRCKGAGNKLYIFRNNNEEEYEKRN